MLGGEGSEERQVCEMLWQLWEERSGLGASKLR